MSKGCTVLLPIAIKMRVLRIRTAWICIKLKGRVRIQLRIKVISCIRIWIGINVKGRIRIRIRIKVTCKIRIRVKGADKSPKGWLFDFSGTKELKKYIFLYVQ